MWCFHIRNKVFVFYLISYLVSIHARSHFQSNTVKEVDKIYIKTSLKYGNCDNVIRQKVKKGIKHAKNLVQIGI